MSTRCWYHLHLRFKAWLSHIAAKVKAETPKSLFLTVCVCSELSWLQAPPAGSTLMAERWVWQWKAWSILSVMCLKLPKHMSSCSWRRFCLHTLVKKNYLCDSKPFSQSLLLQDTFFRYLKSPVYKDIQKKALNPAPHNFRLVQFLFLYFAVNTIGTMQNFIHDCEFTS